MGACLLKSIDIGYRFGVLWALLWLVAGAALITRSRWRFVPLAAVATLFVFSPMYSNHIVFLGWLGIAGMLFTHPVQLRTGVRATVSALYLFAGLAKLNPVFLSGSAVVREAAMVPFTVPFPEVAAYATATLELALAVAVWSRFVRPTRMIAVLFHLAIVVMVPYAWHDLVRMIVFNGATVGALWYATDRR